MSYRDIFNDFLYDMVRGRAEMSRQALFTDWVRDRGFACEGCLEEFTPDPAVVDEDAEVHCPQCLAWKRGDDQGRKGKAKI